MLPVQININMSPSRMFIGGFINVRPSLELLSFENDGLLFWSVLVEVLSEPRRIFEVEFTCVSGIIDDAMKLEISSGLEGEAEIDFPKRINDNCKIILQITEQRLFLHLP